MEGIVPHIYGFMINGTIVWFMIPYFIINISLHTVHVTESQAIQMYNNFQQNKLLTNALQNFFTQYFMNLKPWKFSLPFYSMFVLVYKGYGVLSQHFCTV